MWSRLAVAVAVVAALLVVPAGAAEDAGGAGDPDPAEDAEAAEDADPPEGGAAGAEGGGHGAEAEADAPDAGIAGRSLDPGVAGTPLPDPNVVVRGSGWGTSVGMSQYGALAQAEAGRDHQAILRHYYPGVDLATEAFAGAIRVGLVTGTFPTTADIEALGGSFDWQRCEGGSCTRIARQSGGQTWRVSRTAGGGFRLGHGGSTVWSGGGTATRLRAAHDGTAVVGPSPNANRARGGQRRAAYRHGFMEFSQPTAGSTPAARLTVVQQVPSMGLYLRGLAEVPDSWHAQALQAQVATGRTYAMLQHRTSNGLRAGCRCSLDAGPGNQVYMGWDHEQVASRWVSAVGAVDGRGTVLRHAGSPRSDRLIETFYASSHGGHSENLEDSWAYGSTSRPYLRSVVDPWSNHAANPHRNWSATVSNARFRQLTAPALSRITRVEIRARTAGGTPRTLRLHGRDADGRSVTRDFSGGCKSIAGASLVFDNPGTCTSGGERWLRSQQIQRIGFPPFTDDDGSTHEYSITFAVNAGIAAGRSATRFDPGGLVTRGQMAQFLDNTFDLPRGPADRFSDTRGHTFESAIDAIAGAGIASGRPDGTFGPDQRVSRAQMATFLDQALGLPAGGSGQFSDVAAGDTHVRGIDALASAGIASGCGDGRYCPGGTVLRGQMATFLFQSVLWARS